MNLKKVLGSYRYKEININSTTEYEYKIMDSDALLNPKRFDITCKYYYLKSLAENFHDKLALEIYIEHLKLFGDGKITEPGNPEKNCLEDYQWVFLKLFNDLSLKGWDNSKSVLPLGNDFTLIDGGHRASIALLLGIKVPTVRFPDYPGPEYDYNYFEQRGMKRKHLDVMALNYCLLKKKNIFVCCLWTESNKANTADYIEDCISKYSIVYKKAVKLSYNGFQNVRMAAHRRHTRSGELNISSNSADEKNRGNFRNGFASFYIIETDGAEKILSLKEKIMETADSKYAICFTDTFEESMDLIRIITNDNSLKLFDNFSPYLNNQQMIDTLSKIPDDKILSPQYTLAFFNKSSVSNDLPSFRDITGVLDLQKYFCFENKYFYMPAFAKEEDPSGSSEYDAIKFRAKKIDIDSFVRLHKYRVNQYLTIIKNKIRIRIRKWKK